MTMEMLVLDAYDDCRNAGTGTEQRCWKCSYWMPMVTLEMMVLNTIGDSGNAGTRCEWQHWKMT